jgi:hypothetical protein
MLYCAISSQDEYTHTHTHTKQQQLSLLLHSTSQLFVSLASRFDVPSHFETHSPSASEPGATPGLSPHHGRNPPAGSGRQPQSEARGLDGPHSGSRPFPLSLGPILPIRHTLPYQCLSPMSTESTSTPSLNHLSWSSILTSLPLIWRFLISPFGANVQSSSPYVRHHWPVSSCHSYQNCTAIWRRMPCQ